MIIEPDVFEGYVQASFESALKIVKDDPLEELLPKLSIFVDNDFDGEHEHILIGFGTFDKHRYEMLRLLGMEYGFEMRHVVATVLSTEAWMVQYKDELPDDMPRPLENPDNVEVIITCGRTIDSQAMSIMSVIMRAVEGVEIHKSVTARDENVKMALLDVFWEGFGLAYVTMMESEHKEN